MPQQNHRAPIGNNTLFPTISAKFTVALSRRYYILLFLCCKLPIPRETRHIAGYFTSNILINILGCMTVVSGTLAPSLELGLGPACHHCGPTVSLVRDFILSDICFSQRDLTHTARQSYGNTSRPIALVYPRFARAYLLISGQMDTVRYSGGWES
jgi:hypothetical protein